MLGMASTTPLQDAHLVRFDNPRAHGWQVRLPRWHPLSSGDREYTEFFSDSRFAGPAPAKEAARARRDELFAQAGLPLRLKAPTTNKSNTTGLVGVSLAFDSRYKGETAFSWVALWSEQDGHKRRQKFRLSVYGFEEALRRAIELREEKTGLMFSEEQVLYALSLRSEVDHYASTGRRPRRKAARPGRTKPPAVSGPRASAAQLVYAAAG